jgi:hypothetical protein
MGRIQQVRCQEQGEGYIFAQQGEKQMSIASYSALKTTIADFLDRDDLAAVIPTFISLAEAQMEREIRHYRMVQRSSGQIDSRYSEIPNGWLETIRFHIAGNQETRLELTSLDDMMQLRELSNTPAKPTHYAHVGTTFEIYPTPDTEYEIQLMYYEQIPKLSDSNASNWLLEIAPDAYLYGALVQAAPYLKDDARIAVFGGFYSGAVQAINDDNERARFGGSGIRMRIRSY